MIMTNNNSKICYREIITFNLDVISSWHPTDCIKFEVIVRNCSFKTVFFN